MPKWIIPVGTGGEHGVRSSFARPVSDYIDNLILNADLAVGHPVPSGYSVVVFSCTQDFWVKANGTAFIPVEGVRDGQGCEFNPVVYDLTGVTSLSLISAVDAVVSLAFY
ncbi:MAG: hypothetical protein HQK57_13890, partial [Deltaproteobacteria bacterium]|nr:hypothetical protein [Deltaproteobacteria bacterium]